MIKNNKQHRVALGQIDLLSNALGNARAVKNPDVFTVAHITSLRTDIARLKADVQNYENLKKRKPDLSLIRNISRIGQDLVEARVASNLTHKELAQALGKKEQVIQRWEASLYETASLSSLARVAQVIVDHQKKAA